MKRSEMSLMLYLSAIMFVSLMQVVAFQENRDLAEVAPGGVDQGDRGRSTLVVYTTSSSSQTMTPERDDKDCYAPCVWQKPWYATSLVSIACCVAVFLLCLLFLLFAHYTIQAGRKRDFSLRRLSTSFRNSFSKRRHRRQQHNPLPTLYDVTTIDSVHKQHTNEISPNHVTSAAVMTSRLDRFVGLDQRVPPPCYTPKIVSLAQGTSPHAQRTGPIPHAQRPPLPCHAPPIYTNTADFIDLEKGNDNTGHYLNMDPRIFQK